MNENLKGITIDGESLENYLNKEEGEEHNKEQKADIIMMNRSRKKRGRKTKIECHYNTRPRRIYKGGDMNPDTKKELKSIIEEYRLTGGVLFLLEKGYEINGTEVAKKISEVIGRTIPQSQINAILRKLKKSIVGGLINTKQDGLRKLYSLTPDLRHTHEIPWIELYKVYNNKYPDTITDLKRKYPNVFKMTSKEEAYQQAKTLAEKAKESKERFVVDHDSFSKCPSCQYKSYDDTENRCVACGFHTIPIEETIPNKFDAFTKDVINKALKDKFGQDINVNVNIHVSFEFKK